jgi:hypothetical protein
LRKRDRDTSFPRAPQNAKLPAYSDGIFVDMFENVFFYLQILDFEGRAYPFLFFFVLNKKINRDTSFPRAPQNVKLPAYSDGIFVDMFENVFFC